MTDRIRCTSCLGAKRVPKLGGMIGDCNKCGGSGTILASDIVVREVPKPIEPVSEVIKAVADSIPSSTIESQPVDTVVKIDPKKAIYRRKPVAK